MLTLQSIIAILQRTNRM